MWFLQAYEIPARQFLLMKLNWLMNSSVGGKYWNEYRDCRLARFTFLWMGANENALRKRMKEYSSLQLSFKWWSSTWKRLIHLWAQNGYSMTMPSTVYQTLNQPQNWRTAFVFTGFWWLGVELGRERFIVSRDRIGGACAQLIKCFTVGSKIPEYSSFYLTVSQEGH